jgi:hypothetical protein
MILFGMILLSMLVTMTSCGADETGSRSQGCGRAAPATPLQTDPLSLFK